MEILKHINWVDVLALILILRISYVCSQAGMTHEIFPLIGNAVVLVLSLHFYTRVGNIITKNAPIIPIQIAYFLSFVSIAIVFIIIYKLLNAALNMVLTMEWHPSIEKIGGLIVGIMKAFVVTSLILAMLALMPMPYFQRSIRDKSLTGLQILKIGPVMYGKVAGFLSALKLGSPAGTASQMMEGLERNKTASYRSE
jgi:uncharacterized membrane protein required for colicin V production